MDVYDLGPFFSPVTGEVAMRQSIRKRGSVACGAIWVGSIALIAMSFSAFAEVALRPPMAPNAAQVYLVRQDNSNCTNSDVPDSESPLVGGNVWVTRNSDGTTHVKVAMTAKPNTKYHFFLKCVRLLSDIWTDDEGVANVS